MSEIYFAGGCFWGTEHFFKQIKGVINTETGFANGSDDIKNPTYEQVSRLSRQTPRWLLPLANSTIQMGKTTKTDTLVIQMSRIALIGPESVGKSTLAGQLGSRYNKPVVDEYARTYVEALDRPYTYNDVEIIMQQQMDEFDRFSDAFFDTDMIITKVWFDVVYGRHPALLDLWMAKHKMDFYLLLQPDIKWESQAVRENGNNRRQLYETYRREIEQTGIPYAEINGIGVSRLENAIAVLENRLTPIKARKG